MCKGRIAVVVCIDLLHLLDGLVALGIGGHEDAPCETASLRDEQYASVITWAQLLHRLVNLQQVLMGEGLIDRNIVVAPREMGGGTRLLTSSRATRDAVHVDIAADDACLQSRQHCQLDAGGKTARICQMLTVGYEVLMRLGQTVDIVMVTLDAEVLGEVDDLHVLRNGVFLQEGLALAVTKAEEHHINLVERHLIGKAQLGLSEQTLVDVRNQIASIALAIGKDNLCLRVVDQQTDKFTTRIACSTKDSNRKPTQALPKGGMSGYIHIA